MQGFGFVTFASSVNAEAARLAMNGAVIEGRKIEVLQLFLLLTYRTLLTENILVMVFCYLKNLILYFIPTDDILDHSVRHRIRKQV